MVGDTGVGDARQRRVETERVLGGRPACREARVADGPAVPPPSARANSEGGPSARRLIQSHTLSF